MDFSVLPWRSPRPADARDRAFLVSDSWDDFGFKTLSHLAYVDDDGTWTDIGAIKIGAFGMGSGPGRTELPSQPFSQLSSTHFSLGQDDDYYEHLNVLGPEVRDAVLVGLRDIAHDVELRERALKEEVTGTSLLRSVSVTSVRGQFHRLARGGARLSQYDFSYTLPAARAIASPATLSFAVAPESQPPTNIHVLIGRNGVGKTHVLNQMAKTLIDEEANADDVGRFSATSEDANEVFANLVSVTFSAFDHPEPIPARQNRTQGLSYEHVGLKRAGGVSGEPSSPKSFAELTEEFTRSARRCQNDARAGRWRRALDMLATDPIFRDANVAALTDGSATGASTDEGAFALMASEIFRRLSSGHKIVLLTITRLVETVEERSLVLLDEPETHLHPPLLSAFVRALSDLLIDRNGVAIVATHSPVILQEVPRSCVWKVRRSGAVTEVERPEIETFGENVGVLTREVFGLEVTQSGFHRLLANAVDRKRSYNLVVEEFNDQLGGEALALVRALVAARHADEEGA